MTELAKPKRFLFEIWSERLIYKDDRTGRLVTVPAVTGGGRGQRLGQKQLPHGVKDSRLLTSMSEHEKTTNHHRGGPLPHGLYKAAIPKQHNFAAPGHKPKMVMASALTQITGPKGIRAGGFYIHGTGEHGSDGCIVPTHGHVHEIFRMLTKHHSGLVLVQTHERTGIDFEVHPDFAHAVV